MPDYVPRISARDEQREVNANASLPCYPRHLNRHDATDDEAQSPRDERGETGDHGDEAIGHSGCSWKAGDAV